MSGHSKSFQCFVNVLSRITYKKYSIKSCFTVLQSRSNKRERNLPEGNVDEFTGFDCQATSSSEETVKELLDAATSYTGIKPESADQIWATSPYPEGAGRRNQAQHALRPKTDPRETSIILFPGQGTQFVGMGKDLLKFPIARDLFDAASEILGYDLLKLCLNGPKEKLDKTIHCQHAVLVCALAAVEKLKEERPRAIEDCVATAGFSIGEISSLVFAGSISFERAIRLVNVRAEAMQLASEITPSGMMTVMYGPDSQLGLACLHAKQYCVDQGIEDPDCRIANYLYPHCKVIAGNIKALNFIKENASQYKLRRLKSLPVSGAFHTDLMCPAVEPFKRALIKSNLSDPIISVHSNVDGKRYKNVNHIKQQLPKQIYKPVKWEQTLHILYERSTDDHFPRTFECGPGKSLKTILKMVNAKAWNSCYSIEA